MLDEPGVAADAQAAGAHLVRAVYSWDAVGAATVPLYEALLSG
jgi:hypothetical protein